MDDSTPSGAKEIEDAIIYTSLYSLKRLQIPAESIGCGGCRSVNEFDKIRRVGEGTYGVVYEGRDKRTGSKVRVRVCPVSVGLQLRQNQWVKVALKQVRLDLRKEGMSISVVREIRSLFALNHDNLVRLYDVAVGKRLHKIFLVMEFCDQDLATLLDTMQNKFTEAQVKCLLKQLFQGLRHLHDSYVVHRDIKVSNLLLNNEGVLKIADFGLARAFSDPPIEMTPRVVTLWYRSPELLLGSKIQSPAIDMWASGCIMGELLIHKPLLPGSNEIDQLRRIIQLLGTPTEKIWPSVTELTLLSNIQLLHQPYNNTKTVFPDASADCMALLNRLFVYDPTRRATAEECLESSYMTSTPLPCHPSMMPQLGGSNSRRSSRKRAAVEEIEIL